nr:hypothetical protein CFP56_03067 [Quercus suber]
MARLSMLPADLLVEIMVRVDSLKDLRNIALAFRAAGSAFAGRRSLLIRAVLFKELKLQHSRSVSFCAYQYVSRIVDRLDDDAKTGKTIMSQDIVMFLEAVEPFVHESKIGSTYMIWALRLCHHHASAGPSTNEKRLALLERAYKGILATYAPLFDPDVDARSGADAGSMTPSHGVSHTARLVAMELAHQYRSQGRLLHCLQLEKNIFRRLSVNSSESRGWGRRILITLRALNMQSQVHEFLFNLYTICRTNGWREPALTWARHLVSEHTLAGNTTEALLQQQIVFRHLRRGTDDYIAWGRQLIVMQKRAGLVHEAVATKQEVWESMTVVSACYYGWARELADDYRRLNRFEDAVSVIQILHERSQARLAGERRDDDANFHAKNSARALASELESRGRKHEANSVRAKFCAQHVSNGVASSSALLLQV